MKRNKIIHVKASGKEQCSTLFFPRSFHMAVCNFDCYSMPDFGKRRFLHYIHFTKKLLSFPSHKFSWNTVSVAWWESATWVWLWTAASTSSSTSPLERGSRQLLRGALHHHHHGCDYLHYRWRHQQCHHHHHHRHDHHHYVRSCRMSVRIKGWCEDKNEVCPYRNCWKNIPEVKLLELLVPRLWVTRNIQEETDHCPIDLDLHSQQNPLPSQVNLGKSSTKLFGVWLRITEWLTELWLTEVGARDAISSKKRQNQAF